MIDLTWNVFSQTGNIETYLLLRELEQEEAVSTKTHDKPHRQTPLFD